MNQIKIYAPCNGKLINKDNIGDDVFGQEMLGLTVAFTPESNDFFSVIENGSLKQVFPTKHAFTFEVNNVAILLHIGINTVSKQGEGFDQKANEGSNVNLSTELVSVNWNEVLLDKTISKNTAIIFLHETLPANANLKVEQYGNYTKGQLIATLEY